MYDCDIYNPSIYIQYMYMHERDEFQMKDEMKINYKNEKMDKVGSEQ